MSGDPAHGPGRLMVLAGPSGVGKSTVVAELRRIRAPLWFSVSATTRAARPGEVDGRDYHFVSAAEFNRMIAEGELLEWAEIHGGMHRSGTPRAPVDEHLAAGEPVLLELDLAGARAVRGQRPDALFVFLEPPSWEVLVDRLIGRGTEATEVVDRRLATAREELAARSEFDVAVVNHDVGETARRLVELSVGPPVDGAERGGPRAVPTDSSPAPDRSASGATSAGASE
ncbi:guanylate kinase [Actinomycetospora straminea]|uniref:Guanylate kinase n=1 Tax=Actinomycetospora straminea TaxID=663607 RepID=A0ABP9DVI3_9PSEU|nr:guanylate kinase [Actinomycetospora straminea]MDD7932567.1 guanylate kinase [Actinomycetospora straminea]